jgi:hypothetical protein
VASSIGSTCFELTGRVRRAGPVTAAMLGALPQQEVAVQHYRHDRPLPPRRHGGVLLFDVLRDAGLDGEAGPYPYVNLYLVAFGEDGAAVVFSVAELDPAFGARRVLVGGGDGEEPCRLVTADDRAGARSIRALARVDVRHSGAQAPLPPQARRARPG